MTDSFILVHNDFHSTHGIFKLFNGLQVADLDDPAKRTKHTNGDDQATAQLNGTHKPNDPNVFNEVNT